MCTCIPLWYNTNSLRLYKLITTIYILMIINNNITKKTKKQIKTCQENIVVRRKENFNNGNDRKGLIEKLVKM